MYIEIVKATVPNTYAKIFGQEARSAIWRCDYHLHNEIEIMYIVDSAVTWEFQNTSFTATKGDIVFANARIPHATSGVGEGISGLVIQFDLEKLLQDNSIQKNKYLKRLINGDETPFHHFRAGDPETQELAEYMNKISDEHKERKKAHHIYIKSHLFSIIGFLYRYHYLLDSESIYIHKEAVEKIMPFLAYVDNHYQNDITLNDVSKYFDLNPSYLCRLFKKATNSTFTKYLNLVRIMNAENLLTTTNDSILEVALSVGFPNVSYFNRTFKSYTNCTPGFYKKMKFCK